MKNLKRLIGWPGSPAHSLARRAAAGRGGGGRRCAPARPRQYAGREPGGLVIA